MIGTDESFQVLVGDVTTHQLHNLKPGTTYDLKVLAQYNTGDSAPLIGEGTTCKKMNRLFLCLSSKGSLFALKGYNVLIITHLLQCTWMWRTWPPTTWAMILSASDGPLTGQPPPTGWGSIPLTVSAALIYYKLRHTGMEDLWIVGLCNLTRYYMYFLLSSASKGGAQEITVRGSESSNCFDGLSPDTLYNVTVYAQTPNMEGPGVGVKERTCKKRSSMPFHFQESDLSCQTRL